MNMNSWNSLVLPWTTQKQPVLHSEERVYWRLSLSVRWITTSCEAGRFSHTELHLTEALNLQQKKVLVLTY